MQPESEFTVNFSHGVYESSVTCNVTNERCDKHEAKYYSLGLMNPLTSCCKRIERSCAYFAYLTAFHLRCRDYDSMAIQALHQSSVWLTAVTYLLCFGLWFSSLLEIRLFYKASKPLPHKVFWTTWNQPCWAGREESSNVFLRALFQCCGLACIISHIFGYLVSFRNTLLLKEHLRLDEYIFCLF